MTAEETARRFIDFAVRLKRLFRYGTGNPVGGLSEERFRTLHFLNELDGAGLKALSERIQISPSSLCIMLRKLEDGGFVERTRDEVDRRSVRYRSTIKGDQALKAERDRRLTFFASRFASLSTHERERLLSAMAEIESFVGIIDGR